jgi:hypothetical protein
MFPEWWTKGDKIAFLACLAVAVAVMDGVKEAVGDSLGYWPLIAVRIAAGGAGFLIAHAVWRLFIRPKYRV